MASTSAPPTIIVCGATGAQGGAVVRALLRGVPPEGAGAARAGGTTWRVIGLTRNPEGEAAKKRGEEFAKFPGWAGWRAGDADKPETLAHAFDGAQAAWLVTNYWEHLDGKREEAQGRALVDAAARAGLQTIIYSGLDSPKRRFGVERVHHFEHKYNVEEYLFNSPTTAGVKNRISVRIAYYFDNLLYFSPINKGPDGSLVVVYPMGDAPLKMAHLDDYGASVAAVLDHPERYHLRRINVVSDFLTGQQITDAINAATGASLKFFAPPTEVFASFGFPGADDLAQMFLFNSKCGLEADDEPVIPKSSLHKLNEWCRENAETLRGKIAAVSSQFRLPALRSAAAPQWP